MQNKYKFKKSRLILQLSDGSSINVFSFNLCNEYLMDFDMRSNVYWKKKSKSGTNSKKYFFSSFKVVKH